MVQEYKTLEEYLDAGKTFMDNKDVKKAEAIFLEAQKRFPGRSSPLLHYAKAAIAQKQWVEALGRCDQVIKLHPNNAEGYISKGNALLELNELEQAERHFQKARTQIPDSTIPLAWLARVAMKKNQWIEATKYWTHVIELDPGNAWSYSGKGNALLELKKFEQAEKCFQEARKRLPNRSEPLAGLTRIAMEKKQWRKSLIYWQQLIEKSIDSSWAYIGKGNSHINLKQFREAELTYIEAQRKFPNDLEVLCGYARIAMVTNQWESALIRWTKVLTLAEDSQIAKNGGALALFHIIDDDLYDTGKHQSIAIRLLSNPQVINQLSDLVKDNKTFYQSLRPKLKIIIGDLLKRSEKRIGLLNTMEFIDDHAGISPSAFDLVEGEIKSTNPGSKEPRRYLTRLFHSFFGKAKP